MYSHFLGLSLSTHSLLEGLRYAKHSQLGIELLKNVTVIIKNRNELKKLRLEKEYSS